ncbi:MAG: protein kinase [bacterium]
MTANGKKPGVAPEERSAPLPAPPELTAPPPTEPGLRMLIRSGVRDHERVSDQGPVESILGGPVTTGSVLLDSATIPARPAPHPATRPAQGGLPSTPPDGGATFEVEQTAEWTNEPLPDAVAGIGEQSNVIGGRYRILEGLAMGGMGAVFKVEHLRLGKEFALKIIHATLSGDANMQKYFFREARIQSQLDHPNIVRVTDFGTDDRFGAYLVMEYLRGESLHELLDREERLTAGPALAVALQVAEALHFMHADDKVHCDIKPENVFLVRPPEGHSDRLLCKLIDFGLSRSLARGPDFDSAEVGGTPIYAAPEQLQGVAPQPSMDIYAVGELLFHMLTGRPPFLGSIPEICGGKVSQPPPSPSSLLEGGLDPHLEAVIMKALQTRPEQRQASMSQLVFELRTVVDSLGLEDRRPTTDKIPHAAATTVPGTVAAAESVARPWTECTLPLFTVDPAGRILSATPAFERLVQPPTGQVLGDTLAATKLGNIYPTVDDDVARGALERRPVQRTIKFQTATGQEAALMFWLVPKLDDEGRVTSLWGVLVPV